MKSLVSLGLLALAGVASAEVKPNGTVLTTYCGSVNKSLEVCEAVVQGSAGTKYIVVRPFSKPTIYVRATEGHLPSVPGQAMLTGHGVALSDGPGRYEIERSYQLSLTNRRSGKWGVLYVDGRRSQRFALEGVAHTESVQP